ncbi:MAG TPA: ABC transporter ATP-binding protein [Candidatus Hydrogenedentes bacterium]|nr:ABC transporter ATP-binding protein [Candidatus Hydrogenedentota bacterium]
MSVVIEINKLTKVYEGRLKTQDVHALTELDLAINRGEIFGYLGPNGSGKTTTIKMLLGIIFPTSGSIKVMGQSDIGRYEVRRNIGYLPEGAYYPDFLKGEEVLRFYGQLYGLAGKELERRISEVLEKVGMMRARKRLIKGYSKGMRQRIGLAQAMISDPQILILDEPTTGLDPIARKEIRDILVRLRDEGKTLLISSHELLEVELISDRIGILYEGVMQTQGTLGELLTDRDTAVQVSGLSAQAIASLKEAGVLIEDLVEGRALLRVTPAMSLYDILDRCRALNLSIVSVAPHRETLEELFVRVIGAATGK